ncbi:MAG: BamA/TamA family outer membrane protein [Niabella sp.]
MKSAKIQYLLTAILLLNALSATAQSNYTLTVLPVDKDSAFISNTFNLKKSFINKDECLLYIGQLVPALQTQGYITASVDSVMTDSLSVTIKLFAGDIYKWAAVTADNASREWLSRIGWNENGFRDQHYNQEKLTGLQLRMLNYLENNGYPFARVYIDSLQINGTEVSGKIKVNPGPLYHIDSIKITGNAKISNEYLQQFLDIRNGSVYNKEKLQEISSQLKKLNYVTEKFPPQFIWGSTGGIVELFLEQKKSSQVNFIIGFLPNSDASGSNKLLITGEGLLNLKNTLGSGESIGLIWQKLQAASQQLNITYQQPYLSHSRFGIDLGFNMQKKDSAYLNFTLRLGTQIALSARQSGKIYIQRFSSILSAVDESEIIETKQLPDEADLRSTSVGFEYSINTTNYIFNPVSGFDLVFNTAAGNKKIKRNSQILELEDPDDPDFNFASLYDTVTTKSYQLISVLAAAKYFPLGKAQRSTLKTAINGGYIASNNIFTNELFQIGGYHLLRGFDEQSQYLSQYGIGTLEYRYLAGENSYFNIFTDGGWGKNASRGKNISYAYISAGIGLAFETKVGLFNLAWAVGKRNDSELNLRQSKIHFGFVNYF